MQIVYSPAAVRFLDECDPRIRNRILKKLQFYASSPDPLEFAEHLTDDSEAPYRYRVGKDWRVKFAVERGMMVVKRIGRRDRIYG